MQVPKGFTVQTPPDLASLPLLVWYLFVIAHIVRQALESGFLGQRLAALVDGGHVHGTRRGAVGLSQEEPTWTRSWLRSPPRC